MIGGDGRFYNREVDPDRRSRWPPPTASAGCMVGQGGILSTPAASHVIRKHKAFGGIILSASHNPGGPHGDFGIKYNIGNGGPAPEKITDAIFARTKTIDRYQIAGQRPTSTSTRVGTVEVGGMAVEVIDPGRRLCRADGDAVRFRRRSAPCSPPASACASTPCTRSPAPMRTEILEDALGAPDGTVVNGTPLPDFGGHHPDPNLVHAKELYDLMMGPDAPDFGAASDGDGDRNLIIGKGIFVTPVRQPGACSPPTRIWRRATPPASKGIARSMPTSGAADRVAAKLGIGMLRDADRLEVLRQPARCRHGHHLRRGERRHRLQPCPREGRPVGGAALAQHPGRAQAAGATTSSTSTGRPTAATTIRATTTRRSRPPPPTA